MSKRYRLYTYSRETGFIVGISMAIPLANAERLAKGVLGQHKTFVEIIQEAL